MRVMFFAAVFPSDSYKITGGYDEASVWTCW